MGAFRQRDIEAMFVLNSHLCLY